MTHRELWIGIRRGVMLIIGTLDRYFGVEDKPTKT